MQLIERKTFAGIDSQHLELAFFLTGNESSGFGIKIVEYSDKMILAACKVDNISLSRTEVLEMISDYAENDLCPVHLPYAVRDSIIQRLIVSSFQFDGFGIPNEAEQSVSLAELDDCLCV